MAIQTSLKPPSAEIDTESLQGATDRGRPADRMLFFQTHAEWVFKFA